MAITLNTFNKETRVSNAVKNILKRVEDNANKGIALTDIEFPIDIRWDIVYALEKVLDDGGTDYDWKVIAPSYRNQYGQMLYPTWIDCGDTKMRTLRINK